MVIGDVDNRGVWLFAGGAVLAYAFVEIDRFAPIQAGVDKAHRTAFRAAKVGADILPVPFGQVAQPQSTVVVTSLVVALRAHRSETVDQDRLKAGSSVCRATPIAKVICGFAAPRHGASERGRGDRANYQWAVDWNSH